MTCLSSIDFLTAWLAQDAFAQLDNSMLVRKTSTDHYYQWLMVESSPVWYPVESFPAAELVQCLFPRFGDCPSSGNDVISNPVACFPV
ncbi:hypothetical protein LX32DRAFT_636625 [Colletotrichum zoysiae]|uniref:Uncharacterized protein n=1 Tax=Colletotrichum zoysiae TaxID=1216348 RepID=A0AAD9HNA1_9PEZI|nr:hypothetical protein LX32DRAFT_636625 [Colletotrichum zoysiae]